MNNVLFNTEEGLFQVVRPCTDNGVWKKGLEVYGSRKDCEAYIKIEEPGYLHPKLALEPYNEADWKNSEECVITARDFKSLKAKEQVEYLKLSYEKRKLIRDFKKEE